MNMAATIDAGARMITKSCTHRYTEVHMLRLKCANDRERCVVCAIDSVFYKTDPFRA
jgi:hypothetical protein